MMTDADKPEMSEGTDPSTHISGDVSTRPQRIEVITRSERRRRWSVEQKQAIVEESLAANASILAIARKHGIGTGQLYNWRHDYLGTRRSKASGFARVHMVNEPYRLAAPVPAPSGAPSGVIEIVLPGGATVRVDAQVDEHALRRVLGALRG